MASRMIRICVLAMLCLGMMMTICSARQSAHELNYVKAYETQVEGKDVYRIEIGVNRDQLHYTEGIKSFRPNVLILDLEETIPGRLRHETHLSGKAQKITAQEVELGHTRLQIFLQEAVEDLGYEVYTVPANKAERKPFRLVIDIGRHKSRLGSTEGVKGHHIVLDAGHGGTDSGAVGPSGYMEKEATLAVTQKVRDILENSGAKVLMTRDSDRDVYGPSATDQQELQARVNVSFRDPDAEIFVSVHCNAFSSPSANGTETYYYGGSWRGERLATLLDEELVAAGGLTDRGVKAANFYVMRHSAIPSSLVELAFITNYEEERLLADEDFQDDMAMAIARGIARYFGAE